MLLDSATHPQEAMTMESKDKAWDLAVALVANGSLKFDLDDCLASIQSVEQVQQKIYDAYRARSTANVSATLDALKGFKP